MEPLNRAYKHILQCIAEVGGHAEIDKYGRLVSGPTRHVLQGDAVAYMVLVSRGYLGGEHGQIILTEAGRAVVEAHKAGNICEAS